MTDNQPERLIIISGPSGVGKTTCVRRLLAECPLPLELSVSATTRPMREGETDGVNYHYLTDEQFQEHRRNSDFLEAVEVFGKGHWYGTLKKTVKERLAAGKWLILEIDVEGASRVVDLHPDAITIFLHPGSLEELERRLRGRGTESEEAIQTRLGVASRELDASGKYKHIVINETIDQTVNDLCSLLKTFQNEHGEQTCTTN
ncbi:MAG: guanylate kinase [Planctomycetota bacterium]